MGRREVRLKSLQKAGQLKPILYRLLLMLIKPLLYCRKTLLKRIVKKPLFLPLFSVFLVLIINVVYDAVQGNFALEFFRIELKEGALYGRIIDILNRGSEAAILAIGMTLAVSSSAGTDISVGSVMSLSGSLCCMLLAGFGVTHVREVSDLRMPIFVGVIAGIGVAVVGCTAEVGEGLLGVAVVVEADGEGVP